MYDKIKDLSDKYAMNLKEKIDIRTHEMYDDDNSHYLIYKILGISSQEGHLIDLYQNKGRFLYKYAGAFLEEVTKLCFKEKFPEAKTTKILNLFGKKPQKYEIDCLIDNKAIEIKWRDATTDGDHINKEHDRIRTIHETGLIPIRIMFYYPNREQAKRHQRLLETLYKGLGGEYYHSDDAWNYIFQMTSINLKDILQDIAHDKIR